MGEREDIRRELLAASQPSLLELAVKQYPVLGKYSKNLGYRYSPSSDGRMLEFYTQGERDSFDPSRPSIEVFSNKTRPEDVAGDIVSHYLNSGVDPRITDYYQRFQAKLHPRQREKLREQYEWARKNNKEERPYKDWEQMSGLPAYFRGYAFNQWEHPEEMYPSEQIEMFDEMNRYLRGQE